MIFKDAETLIGMKQQPAREGGVDDKIEEQHQFVAWWDANVRGAGGVKKSFFPYWNNDFGARG